MVEGTPPLNAVPFWDQDQQFQSEIFTGGAAVMQQEKKISSGEGGAARQLTVERDIGVDSQQLILEEGRNVEMKRQISSENWNGRRELGTITSIKRKNVKV